MLMMLVRAGSLIREVRGSKTLLIQPVQWLRRNRQRRRDPAPLRFTGDVGRTLTLGRGSGAPELLALTCRKWIVSAPGKDHIEEVCRTGLAANELVNVGVRRSSQKGVTRGRASRPEG
jgi:hypothetical protein